MSTINTGLKALACGMGAVVISTVMSWSLVESTSAAPFATTAAPQEHVAKLTAQQSRHVWFGQSEPAVLVD